jgi:hypothetical protein
LIPTFIFVAVDASGMGTIPPLLPFYSPRLGATPFVVGALISVYSRCQLVAGPAVRMLSDSGRRDLVRSQTSSDAMSMSNDRLLPDLARNRHADCTAQCPFSGAKWKTYA